MTNDEEKMIKEKVKTFFKLKILVHISLKNKDWRNGKILSVSDKFFLLNEKILGQIPIFYSDIYEIDKLKGVGE
jgi:hypothetical protein